MTNVNEFTNLGISNFAFIFTIINTILLCYFFYKTDMNIVKAYFRFLESMKYAKNFIIKMLLFSGII